MIVSFRDKRTRDFAAGKRVKALSGIERSARLKLDRLEVAVSLQDLAALPGNRLEVLSGAPQGAIQHSHQRSMADLLRVASEVTGSGRRRNFGLSLA
jgi:plasmid maintenance system killer protein